MLNLLLASTCMWSTNDFKNEIDIQIYKISNEIEILEKNAENALELEYLKGKLDVYISLQESMNQKPRSD
jgi:hypothetical protein